MVFSSPWGALVGGGGFDSQLAIRLLGTMSYWGDGEVVQTGSYPYHGALMEDLGEMEMLWCLIGSDDLSDCSTYMHVCCNLQASRHWLLSINVYIFVSSALNALRTVFALAMELSTSQGLMIERLRPQPGVRPWTSLCSARRRSSKFTRASILALRSFDLHALNPSRKSIVFTFTCDNNNIESTQPQWRP